MAGTLDTAPGSILSIGVLQLSDLTLANLEVADIREATALPGMGASVVSSRCDSCSCCCAR